MGNYDESRVQQINKTREGDNYSDAMHYHLKPSDAIAFPNQHLLGLQI